MNNVNKNNKYETTLLFFLSFNQGVTEYDEWKNTEFRPSKTVTRSEEIFLSSIGAFKYFVRRCSHKTRI